MAGECEEDAIEAVYWFFDALRAGTERRRKEAGLGPMAERDAFKAATRNLLCRRAADLSDEEVEALRWLRQDVAAEGHSGLCHSETCGSCNRHRLALAALDRLLSGGKP